MLISIILLPLILGTSLMFLLKRAPRALLALVALAVAGTTLALVVSQSAGMLAGQRLQQDWMWLPELGLNFSLRMDALAWLFALLITSIGCLIFFYAYFYLGHKNSLAKLYGLLLFFMAAMLGIVLSNHLLLLLLFWELTSISSFLLVAYWPQYEASQRGARMALSITGMGGLALLAAFLLLGHMAGSYQIDQILTLGSSLQTHALFMPFMLLTVIAAFSKSAQFPLHFWLPNAMAAPTPVSAYLHSATMVKAGIFLLLLLSPLMQGFAPYHNIVTFIGFFTLTMGAFFAIFKEDLKGLLAYSTISHLGLIVCLIGIGSPLAIAAAIFHIINHAMFKAALFMLAGIVDHETGTRDLRKLSGVAQLLPITATLAIIASAAMAGVPLTNGFLSKEMFLGQLLGHFSGGMLVVMTMLATIATTLAVMYSWRLLHGVFFDGAVSQKIPHQDAHDPVFAMQLPIVILVVLCLVIGIAPAFMLEHLIHAVSQQVLPLHNIPTLHLALWHGWNLALGISIVALLGGTSLYFYLVRYADIRHIDLDPILGRLQGKLLFDVLLKRLWHIGYWLRIKTATSSLQQYLLWILLFVLALLSSFLWPQHLTLGSRLLTPAPLLAIVMWLLLFTGCWMLLWFHHERIKAIMISGAIGLVVTITFMLLSAPDLALTQITVDIVTTVLLLMSLSLLPQLTPYESKRPQRWRDAGIAIAVGVGMTWLTWLMLSHEHQSISWFFIQQSLPLGGGSNVVNVILVDFRGFDTFGEITVLAIAGIGALCMMDGMRAHGTVVTQGLNYRFNPSPLMLRFTASWILPLALVVSMFIFLRGHNQPGGGFIAGLVTAIALILQYIALGQDHTEQLLRAQSGRLYEKWIAFGLAVSGFTGMAAWYWARPFLTSAHVHLHPPFMDDLHLASAALFDLGVYATVVGSSMLIISVLGDSRHSTLSGPLPPQGNAS